MSNYAKLLDVFGGDIGDDISEILLRAESLDGEWDRWLNAEYKEPEDEN